MRRAHIPYALVAWQARKGRTTLTGDFISDHCDEGALVAMAKTASNNDEARSTRSQLIGSFPTDTLTGSIRLVATAAAVACAREFVTEKLRRWNVPGSVVDDACLITSELVTNAVRVTGSLEAEPSLEALVSLPFVGLTITVAGGRLLIEVADDSDVPPQIHQQYATAESGRGLFLVTMLAEQWSYCLVAAGGKVVWAELVLPRLRTEPKSDLA
jgi:anti-sigma regulatory factor (Ser/Thr protein kinase)